MKTAGFLTASALCALAGTAAMAVPPVIDGSLDASYGAPKWVNTIPTRFGDNSLPPPGNASQPRTVGTGIEFRIPLSVIGNPTSGPIRMGGFISNGGYNFLSNQILGSLDTNNSPNLGEPRSLNFTNSPYDSTAQFLVLTPVTIADGAITLNGQRDTVYGSVDPTINAGTWEQTQLYTNFGNSDLGEVGNANGSEINNISLARDSQYLYVFIGGNLRTDFSKLSLFFDTIDAQGQNTLRNNNPGVDFNGLNRMGGPATEGPGLTWDPAFAPDFWMSITGNGTALFVNYAELTTAGGGFGTYIGSGGYGVTGGTLNFSGGAPAGPLQELRATIDNSNTLGIIAPPPPMTGDRDISGGSEIAAVYSTIVGNRLYVLVTGNLETNGNKMSFFFDARPGGQNRLRGSNDPFWPDYRGNVDIDFGGLTRMGALTRIPIPDTDPQQFQPVDPTIPEESGGLTFDEGFAADYWFSFQNFGNPVQVFANAAILRTGGRAETFNGNSLDYGSYDGGSKGTFPSTFNPMTFTSDPIIRADPQDDSGTNGGNVFATIAPRSIGNAFDFNTQTFTPAPQDLVGKFVLAIDNSNIDGIPPASDTLPADPVAVAAAAEAVTTGLEFSIDLNELGWDGESPIKMAGFIQSGDYGFVSNQVFGGIPTGTNGQPDGQAANLGEVRNINFASIAGTQYVILFGGPSGPTPCNPADIAATDATPGADGCVDNGDFSLFIASFFSASCSECGLSAESPCNPADIAQTDSTPGFDGCVDNGDFSLFIASFFVANCTETCIP